MTYFSIFADFQNSGANVQNLCFYLLIPQKDLLIRFAILSDHSQTSRLSLGVFNIFITFCVDPWQRKMLKCYNYFFFLPSRIFITGVIQLIPPVLSSETLLHILLSSEYSDFRPSTTAVVTISAPVSVSTGPKFRRYSAQLTPRKIVKKVFIVISNVFPTFLTYR